MSNALASKITVDLIDIPASGAQRVLRLYEDLCALLEASPGAWRDCALRLRAAASEVPAVFRRKYLDRAVQCDARVADLMATNYVVVPSVAPVSPSGLVQRAMIARLATQEDGGLAEQQLAACQIICDALNAGG